MVGQRASFVLLASAVLISISLVSVRAQSTPSAAVDLRVACRKGQPPFIDAPTGTAASCQGLMLELFKVVVARTGWNYTLDVVESSALEPFIQVNATTNTSRYDLILAFHTITPSRLRVHDFSVNVVESDDRVELAPKYRKSNSSLIGAVWRKAVLYIFMILAIGFAGMGAVILAMETWHGESELAQLPMWRRILVSLEQGVESLLTSSTSLELSSQLARSIRSVAACIGVFVVSIFGAVLTSQLTIASVTVVPTDVTSLAGAKIAIASSTLVPYLTGSQVKAQVTTFSNLEHFAEQWYNNDPAVADFDGFCTSAEVVSFIHNKYGAAKKGFAPTPPFKKTGTSELKGYPMSRNLDPKVKLRFNQELQLMRETGQLSTLLLRFVKEPEEAATPDDVPVATASKNAFAAITGVGYSIILVVATVLFIRHKMKASRDSANNPDETTAAEPTTVIWAHRAVPNVSPAQAAVLDAIVAACKASSL